QFIESISMRKEDAMRVILSMMAVCGVGCSRVDAGTRPPASEFFPTAGTRMTMEAILDYGTVVFATNPTTLLEPLDFHKYEFDGHAGGTVTITAQASSCGDPDLVINLFTADDFDAGRVALIENDDSTLPCFLDSRISNFRLPVDGTYVLVVRSFRQQGT